VNDWVADWDDVLRRAGYSRVPSKRAAAIAATAAVAVLLLLPGIGIGGGLNAWLSSPHPRPGFTAPLTLPGGQAAGVLSLPVSRGDLVGAQVEATFPARGRKVNLPRVQVPWSLDLAGGKSPDSAVIHDGRGKVVVRLCAPCSTAHGTMELPPLVLLTLAGDDAVVRTVTGVARGTLRLQEPTR